MTRNNRKLYDAFGELLYVLAKSDGIVQKNELETLDEVLSDHPWSKEIKWSFNYESNRDGNLEDTFRKVFLVCSDIGPSAEYKYMIDVLEKVAKSSWGISENEQMVIDKFKNDLTEEFRRRS